MNCIRKDEELSTGNRVSSLNGRAVSQTESCIPGYAAARRRGAGRTTYKELSKIWGVSYPQIIKDSRKIAEIIQENIKPKYQR